MIPERFQSHSGMSADSFPGGKEEEGSGMELGTAAFHLTVGATTGLWITRHPATRAPMQQSHDGGASR